MEHNQWFFDSGSSIHICDGKTRFETYKAASGEEITGIAGTILVKGKGVLCLMGYVYMILPISLLFSLI